MTEAESVLAWAASVDVNDGGMRQAAALVASGHLAAPKIIREGDRVSLEMVALAPCQWRECVVEPGDRVLLGNLRAKIA